MPTYDSDNIFAKILAGKIPAVKIFENETCLAIMDVFPQSKGHCLVIPKAKSRNLFDADPAKLAQTIPYVQKLANAAFKAMNADGVTITQYNEAPAGQSVFHLHWHVIPVYEGTALGRHGEGMADVAELEQLAKRISTVLG